VRTAEIDVIDTVLEIQGTDRKIFYRARDHVYGQSRAVSTFDARGPGTFSPLGSFEFGRLTADNECFEMMMMMMMMMQLVMME
jgi:hypothetical protein